MCGNIHTRRVHDETAIYIGVNPNHTTIAQAILESFQHDVDDVECMQCRQNRTKHRETEIVAAPKILRIQLQILMPQHKIFHHLTYPNMLDLTTRQQIPTLPLQYRLSSVVSHTGDFVDAETGGVERVRFPRNKSSKGTVNQPPSRTSEKMIVGHYIASVLEPDGTYSTVNDSGVRTITQRAFLSNPQRSAGQGFEVSVLTYVRDDSVRPQQSSRWLKEIISLRAGASTEDTDAGEATPVRLTRGTKRKRGQAG